MMNAKIQASHLDRQAIIYARQSTLRQLHEHQESTRRQYALKERAIEFGWSNHLIVVIDEDLGQSGASAEWRVGFQRLAESVAHGRVGGIFSLEVSRLARSSSDWHKILELCSLADVVIADEQAVYSPRDYNDRLLLGLKGTMSEAELYWMRLRLEGGRLSKARRGELFFCPPAGYEWNKDALRFRLDPSEEVQNSVKLVFERFRIDGSSYAVCRYLLRMGIKIPSRDFLTKEVIWIDASSSQVLQMLHNPIYTGSYVFGRKEERMGLVDGKLRRRKVRYLDQSEWKSIIHNHHPAYITWEDFEENEKKLHDNQTHDFHGDSRGPAREGHAILQGLVLCGRCGRRMSVSYRGSRRRTHYQCCDKQQILKQGICWGVRGDAVERVVEQLFLKAVTPEKIDLTLNVMREVEHQLLEVDHQWKARKERLGYEARLAERRYKATDPDNRVVARTLEREWEERLRDLESAEQEYEETRKREKLHLSAADKEQLKDTAKNLHAVWRAKTTTFSERKNLLRILIRQVTLSPVDIPERMTRIQIWWHSGAVSEAFAPRKNKFTAVATPEEAVRIVKKMVESDSSDVEIAEKLNQLGIPRRSCVPWDKHSVQKVRYTHGYYRATITVAKTENTRANGLLSVHGVAEKLNVPPGLVMNWANTGLLPIVDGGKTTKARWFKLDEELIQKLNAAREKRELLRQGIEKKQ